MREQMIQRFVGVDPDKIKETPDDVKAPETASAYNLNLLRDNILRQGNLTVSAPLDIQYSSTGMLISLIERPKPFFATLSGTANPYNWTQVDATITGTPKNGYDAYEVNEVEDLDGKTVLLHTENGDHRFVWEQPPCCDDEADTTCCSIVNCLAEWAGRPLYIINQDGTHTLNWNAGTSTWNCCYAITRSYTASTDPTFGVCGSTGSGTSAVQFTVGCISTGGALFYCQQKYISRYCTTPNSSFLSRDASCSGDAVVSSSGESITSTSPTSQVAILGGIQFNFATTVPIACPGATIVSRYSGGPPNLTLSDGVGSVTLEYFHAQKPAMNTGTFNTSWYGCLTRSSSNGKDAVINSGAFEGSGGCTGSVKSVNVAIVYILTCTSGTWRLSLNTRMCGFSGPSYVIYYFLKGVCSPWGGPGGVFSGYGGPVVENITPNVVADDCHPFALTFTKTFPAVGPTDAQGGCLGTMFGTGGTTWTVSE